MDVLRPPLIRIGGRVYRKSLVQEQAFPHEEEEDFCAGPGDCADEPCGAFVVEETERGFQCRVEVPSPLYKYIIGKKGETKKRLEAETRTSISIPKPGVEGEIVITGQHRSGVTSARTRIDVLLDSFRKKQPFTHFLSFALNQPAVQQRFLQFKEEVLEKCSKDHGVSSSLFQNPAKLHLTLGTLVLLNEQEIQKACDLLQRCKEDFVEDFLGFSQVTGGQPLTVEVAGVEYMNDDPAMTDVLYAKVRMKDGSDRLQMVADQLVERFVASGLMRKEWDRVKLHATVMNTLFRKDPTEEQNSTMTGKSSFKERESFNGQNILKPFQGKLGPWQPQERTGRGVSHSSGYQQFLLKGNNLQVFENFHFGEVQLDSVRLSQRFSSDASGYYATSGQLCFS
ncbi:activating signal cointegrator 1 complex subunit 1 isoform X1 [Corvus hawaiiensis]|uniref:activating signal cointegrator 1 complex subunit 1 isoform X1 n=1 Tax=Corvus hawaiiensis TaxID=134902 RepID=UPI002018AE59|nr:activating signal cointegrator 1 complex subunit 1 isoform X1 [Corvus hawaiiensis]XP_048167754.1 activating signal cointegrator 1 complex subunit 1 isoform X1 [Corvus hawaiiensis]XP_048167756.1 activating signal cointegrator 1 complex subunit 1 isoform X1 [Corvus hawaiiensis]XP_048167760.1 activating signal cointegrator 1 complex subunit 1 isoform X1 [Corvus hawaiiensis]